ncbi:sulfite exporter TauE/SafE family protein [Mumia sp. zg.B53]|uniref:sulfite exporter TauE/SafE family protein n=1 Tax=unclassified Mumia TaxID=2621872 RepID=UPI001C6EA672|nr:MULTISPECIES: sulfite exporter TauE/SafE family protein [unclassified Mumia]MBW9215081.1 sulfite exporter TauE/SafE family protein [Mumia sp. zg.B53]MDD9349503.1 sulfite exporter TauE/SafE family protein [Mumia sp.]
MTDILTYGALSILAVSFGVGIVVGLTGMGGGALMTPALIFLGINPTAAVANDLVAASVNKSVGAAVHAREGSPNWRLAGWLMLGSVPTAAAGAFIIEAVGGAGDQTAFVKTAIGAALVLTAATYTLRSFLNVRAVRQGRPASTDDPTLRPIPTVLVGAVGGLLVGVTSVGSGSLIMVSLLLLYPALTAVRLVGTDLVQAVPLVLSAAITHVLITGVDLEVLVPLILGGTPGTYIGARIANRVPQGIVRRGIVVVLTLTGLTLLGVDPVAVGLIAAGMVILGPIAWALLRDRIGVPEGVDLFAEKRDVDRARRADEETR